jgi:hypothetical protein
LIFIQEMDEMKGSGKRGQKERKKEAKHEAKE